MIIDLIIMSLGVILLVTTVLIMRKTTGGALIFASMGGISIWMILIGFGFTSVPLVESLR